MKTKTKTKVSVTREDINRFFRALRKAGFFAEQKYWCCNSCGCAALEGDMNGQDKWVFYHEQDAESFYGSRHYSARGNLFLTYGDLEGKRKATEAVGREICEIARSCGLEPKWDGSWATRIEIERERNL